MTDSDFLIIGVAIVLREKDGFLFELQRSAKWKRGRDGVLEIGLSCIGGTVEEGETLEGALQRETMEEIGCTVAINSSTHPFSMDPGGQACRRLRREAFRMACSSCGRETTRDMYPVRRWRCMRAKRPVAGCAGRSLGHRDAEAGSVPRTRNRESHGRGPSSAWRHSPGTDAGPASARVKPVGTAARLLDIAKPPS